MEINWSITPGSMGALGVAIDLLGLENIVSAGTRMQPFIVKGCHGDVRALVQTLNETDPERNYTMEPIKLRPGQGTW